MIDGMIDAPPPFFSRYSLAVYTAIAGDSLTLHSVTFTADVPALEGPDVIPASVVPRLPPSPPLLEHLAGLPSLLTSSGSTPPSVEAIIRLAKAHAALTLPALATLALWAPLPEDTLSSVVNPTVLQLLTNISELVGVGSARARACVGESGLAGGHAGLALLSRG
jgi:hypothetical protein